MYSVASIFQYQLQNLLVLLKWKSRRRKSQETSSTTDTQTAAFSVGAACAAQIKSCFLLQTLVHILVNTITKRASQG